MRRHWPHIALALGIIVLIVVFGACTLTGPTCEEYLAMGDTQRREAARDWLVFNDLLSDAPGRTAADQLPATQQFLAAQCAIQVQQDIPTMLNQFRP